MSTDFTYNNTLITSSGPFKPKNRNVPMNARYRVDTYADIANIPVPAVGELIFVLSDENNDNKQNIYVIKSLKASNLGVADSLVNEVVPLKTFLGTDDINLSDYVTEDELNTSLSNKADKVSGYSLVSDTEIARLANVDNYDDSEIRGLIPTKLSELENDSNFVNQNYVDDKLTEISTSGVITEDIADNDIFIASVFNNTDIVTDSLEGWWTPAVKVNQTLYDNSNKSRNVTYPDNVKIENNKLSVDANGSANVEIDIEPTEILTIEYVINLTAQTNGTAIGTYYYDKSAGMRMRISSGRWFTMSVGYDSTSEGEDIDESMTIYSNNNQTTLWQPVPVGIHHILIRYNSELSRVEAFIDGQLSTAYKDLTGKKTPVFSVSKVGFNSRGIGFNDSNSIQNAEIYDMKIYSKMLSDEEISKNYNSVKYIIEGQ